MRPMKIKGVEYDRLAVASSKERCVEYLSEYLCGTKVTCDDDGNTYRSDGKRLERLFVLPKGKKWYLLCKY